MTLTEIRAAIIVNNWQLKTAGEIAELLNAPKVVLTTCVIGEGTLMDVVGAQAGADVLDAMDELAKTNNVIRRGMKLLYEAKLDLALASTRMMIDAVLPVDEASALKGLAEQTVTAGVTQQQVIDAMEGI
jgi:hypothetical protein